MLFRSGGSDDYRHLKTMLYGRPDLLHRILEVNARAVTDYLNAQIEAGAQAVMIFDTWGGNLTLTLSHLHDVSLSPFGARMTGTLDRVHVQSLRVAPSRLASARDEVSGS